MTTKNYKHKLLLILGVLFIGLFSFNVNAADSVDTSVNVRRTITQAPPKIKDNTFKYTVTPDSGNPGIVTGYPEDFSITFKDISAGNATAILDKNITFNDAVYTKPGDYKFTVKETESTDTVSYPISNDEWEIRISVRYKVVDGVPTNKLIFKAFAVANKNDNSKSESGIDFSKDANFSDIHISGDTSGNMANLNKYFKYKVTVHGDPGDTYTIEGQDSVVKYDGANVTTSTVYTVGEDNQYIYLKDNQSVTIGQKTLVSSSTLRKRATIIQKEIKIGTKYTIEEMGGDAYKTYYNGSSEASKTSPEMTVGDSTSKLRILNVYSANIINGVMYKVLPYVLLLFVVGLIFILMKVKNSKKDKDIK